LILGASLFFFKKKKLVRAREEIFGEKGKGIVGQATEGRVKVDVRP
jgi:hypothetical protein